MRKRSALRSFFAVFSEMNSLTNHLIGCIIIVRCYTLLLFFVFLEELWK